LTIQYEQYYRHARLSKPGHPDLVFNERLRFAKIARHIPENGRILDLGCGAGDLGKYCGLDPARLVGVDLSEEKLKQTGYHRTAVASAERLPFEPGSFDVIVASEVLEHVADPASVVKEVRRVAAPAGRLIVSVPFEEEPVEVECPHCLTPFFLSGHVNYFDRDRMKELLALFNPHVRLFVVNNIVTRYLNRHLGLPFHMLSALDLPLSAVLTRSSKYLIGVAG
jgi:SAM-dependent methyltransferase